MQSIQFLSYDAFASNWVSFQYRDDNLNLLTRLRWSRMSPLPISEAKAQLQVSHKLRWSLDIWNGCGLLSYMSTPKDVYKILQKAKLSRFFVVRRNEMSRVEGKPRWANSNDFGLAIGCFDVGAPNISLHTLPHKRNQVSIILSQGSTARTPFSRLCLEIY